MRLVTDPGRLDRAAWLRFVEAHPHGTVFQTPHLAEVHARTEVYEPVLTAFVERGEVVGLLLGCVQREAEGVYGTLTARAVAWGGPLLAPGHDHLAAVLVRAHDTRLARLGAIYSQLRNLWNTDPLRAGLEASGHRYEPHLNLLVDLEPGPEAVWKQMKRSGRKAVRRAERLGVTVRVLQTPAEFRRAVALVDRLYTRLGLPLPPPSFFEALWERLVPPGIVRTFGAFWEDELIGTRLVTCFGRRVYDLYAASVPAHYDKRPNDLLPWRIMEWAMAEGYAVFDWGGAGKPGVPYGVRDYKLKFGGRLVEHGRYEKVLRPRLYRLGAVGLAVRQQALRIARAG